MQTSLSAILAYGLMALIGLLLLWATRFSHLQDQRDIEEYRREFLRDPAKRTLEDMADLASDIPPKFEPLTPYLFGTGLLLTVIGVLMLIHIGTSTPAV